MNSKIIIASSKTKKGLEKLINEYFFSNNYIITDDNRVFNTKLNKYNDNVKIIIDGKRYQLHSN